MIALSVLAWFAIGLQAAAGAYLSILAAASLLPSRRSPRGRGRSRFAIIVPAHNEEEMLPRLLASIERQAYDGALYSVHVIADNCTDGTARVARAGYVTVHERHQPDNPGKGQAIKWLLSTQTLPEVDAFVFVDADSSIDEGFLHTADAYLEGTSWAALQSHYAVHDDGSSHLVALRSMAFALMHGLRGRGKARLGLSCGLWGNGMVIRASVLDRMGWQSMTAVEDAEQHLRLLLLGERVRYLPEVSVYGHMPTTFAAARDQQRRWEGGRLLLLRRYTGKLLSAAITRPSPSAAAAAFELALPPLSFLGLLSLALPFVALALAGSTAATVSGLVTLSLAGYVVIGLLRSGLPARTYLSLLYAPRFILWKLWLYVRELPRRDEPAWTRTLRD